MLRSATLLAALLLATACSAGDADPAADTAGGATTPAAAASAGGSGDDDLEDITSYELSMDRIDRYYAAQRNMALRMRDMSPAEREAMRLADDEVDTDDGGDSLEDMARRIEEHAVMRDAVREAGLSPREFATLTMSMVQASMAAMVLQMRPEANQDSLVREMKASPTNVRFVRENRAELDRKQAEFQAEMQRLGVDMGDGDDQGDDQGGDPADDQGDER